MLFIEESGSDGGLSGHHLALLGKHGPGARCQSSCLGRKLGCAHFESSSVTGQRTPISLQSRQRLVVLRLGSLRGPLSLRLPATRILQL